MSTFNIFHEERNHLVPSNKNTTLWLLLLHVSVSLCYFCKDGNGGGRGSHFHLQCVTETALLSQPRSRPRTLAPNVHISGAKRVSESRVGVMIIITANNHSAILLSVYPRVSAVSYQLSYYPLVPSRQHTGFKMAPHNEL